MLNWGGARAPAVPKRSRGLYSVQVFASLALACSGASTSAFWLDSADKADKCARERRNVVPVMAIGVAELKRELKSRGGLTEFPEIHQFLDGFYLSRIGIRILIGQHIALHEPQKENHIGAPRATSRQPRLSPHEQT